MIFVLNSPYRMKFQISSLSDIRPKLPEATENPDLIDIHLKSLNRLKLDWTELWLTEIDEFLDSTKIDEISRFHWNGTIFHQMNFSCISFLFPGPLSISPLSYVYLLSLRNQFRTCSFHASNKILHLRHIESEPISHLNSQTISLKRCLEIHAITLIFHRFHISQVKWHQQTWITRIDGVYCIGSLLLK